MQYRSLYQQHIDELVGLGWIHPLSDYAVPTPSDQGEALVRVCEYMEDIVTPLRSLYSWAVPTVEALEAISSFSPCGLIEVGAGTGYWASLLEERGVSVEAFDIAPPDGEEENGQHFVNINIHVSEIDSLQYHGNSPPFTTVQRGTPSVASIWPERTLLLCWPPREQLEEPATDGAHENTCGFDALTAFSGDCVVYVGEWEGQTSRQCRFGETGGPRLQAGLRDAFDVVKRVSLPRWPFAQDDLTVWVRRAVPKPLGTTLLPKMREPKGFKRQCTHGSDIGSRTHRDDKRLCIGKEPRKFEKDEPILHAKPEHDKPAADEEERGRAQQAGEQLRHQTMRLLRLKWLDGFVRSLVPAPILTAVYRPASPCSGSSMPRSSPNTDEQSSTGGGGVVQAHGSLNTWFTSVDPATRKLIREWLCVSPPSMLKSALLP
eukprot:CAMPEP_0114566260 /NCGR_PEP_ID=MMETSP0114-20121206/14785_1 /TAXON_ID=31324 /ORGANISM="Goniomonas sp, Strain m" /LENGTH=431 /DNA_ID=CAMNT_0001752635 /DNA_START=26 /DNA_END=1317 /DNA_ORIENTATION=+